MTLEYFSVFDSAAARFLEPFAAPTVEVALRRFRATIENPETDFARFPEDYTLFHVGQFDQEEGLFRAFQTPHSLGVAVTYKKMEAFHG